MLNATYFTYDDIKSETYNLMIADIDDAAVKNITALSPTLYTTRPPTSSHFLHNGIEYVNAPQHTFTVFSTNGEIDLNRRTEVLSWLMSSDSFKELRFRQTTSPLGTSYRCVFTNAESIYIDNRCCGFKLTAAFDSPYSVSMFETSGPAMSLTINIHTDIVDEYIYPIVEFTGDGITIVNETDDSNRPFAFTGCGTNAKGVRVDNELKTITSNDTLHSVSLSNFTSKNWLRLRSGENELSITGNGSVKIRLPRYQKLGF